jgi:hypothetical protein
VEAIYYILIYNILLRLKLVLKQMTRSLTLLSLLVAIVIVTSILDSARGASDGLVIQNVEISPRVAKIGENVTVNAKIRNTGKNTTNCNITTYVGKSVVEELKEITISPQNTIPLMFTVNTNSLQEGNYAIETIIEQTLNEQAIFDLGTITVAQESYALGQGAKAIGGEASFNMLYLLPVFPVGAVVSFFALKRRRSKRKEDKLSEDLLPNLLNEVLNFEGKVETGVVKNKKSSNDKSYVC